MNERAFLFFKNILYAVGANASRIVTTMFLTLLLPKLMSLENYSYWQLYGFYGVYLACSSLGWCEGTYIKYGGSDYKTLDQGRMSSQFWMLALYEAVVLGAIYLICFRFLSDTCKMQALSLSLVYTWLSILRYQLQIILQATNRILEYARVYTGERLVNFVLVIVCLVTGRVSFQIIAEMEIISNVVMLFYAVYLCQEMILHKPLLSRESLMETRELVSIGYKLTLASFASQAIIGIVRFAIENKWGTVAFGKISLALSMANVLITCISAVGIVLFPMLRNTERSRLFEVYQPARLCLTILMYGILIFYMPVKIILGMWLPQYEDSMRYLAILFPLCIYETRNTVLTWTYLKTLRRERDIMKANLVMVAVSMMLTLFTVYLLQNLELAVLSIIALYAAKAVYTEVLLGKYMPLHNWTDHIKEGLLTVMFIFCNWVLSGWYAFFGYLGVCVLYFLAEKKLAFSYAKLLKQLTAR